MIDEIIYWGCIEIPYPYLESYTAKLLTLKEGERHGINFSKLVEPPKDSYKAAIASFSEIVRPEIDTEIEIVEGFEFFLKRIEFLSATLLIAIDTGKTLFFQYVFNGEDILKFHHTVLSDNDEPIVFKKTE